MGGRCTMTQNNPTCHFASTLSLLPWVDEEYPNKYTNKVFIAFLLCNLYGLFWNQRACFSNIACRIQLIRLFMFHAGIHLAPPNTQLIIYLRDTNFLNSYTKKVGTVLWHFSIVKILSSIKGSLAFTIYSNWARYLSLNLFPVSTIVVEKYN